MQWSSPKWYFMRLGYEAWSDLCDFNFKNKTSMNKGTHLQLYILLFCFFISNLWIFIFDVQFLVYFCLQLFLFNLVAGKLCVVSFIHFSILEISVLPSKVYDSPHLKNYGSYIHTFLRGYSWYCMWLEVHMSRPSRSSFSVLLYNSLCFGFTFLE